MPDESTDIKWEIKDISLNINREKTNVILGERIVRLYGDGYITDRLLLPGSPEPAAVCSAEKESEERYIENSGMISFRISPLSFYQVNPVQTEKLYRIACEYANLTGNEVVWDLYCGIGTISLFMAKHARKVYGVEVIPEAIEDAKKNAEINGIDNVQFFVGKAEGVMIPEKPDVIVVDPPRKGCDAKLIDTICEVAPNRVVYVSCDPATLARDIKKLGENGFEFVKARPVDQFGHSTHVETVVLMSRVKD